ncbi:hypothetical protein GCM10011529_01650 [Polymorphobacter glacialis]|uniref:Uncharacterized protein n=1 Tax=Sandarakinorhabdus glacialis TaxID=1614636 RepID=A0A916ZIQ5_9SPHN|nr:hypothetical protein GCM10011529_01650 [Polymorphobacter glacialis]
MSQGGISHYFAVTPAKAGAHLPHVPENARSLNTVIPGSTRDPASSAAAQTFPPVIPAKAGIQPPRQAHLQQGAPA